MLSTKGVFFPVKRVGRFFVVSSMLLVIFMALVVAVMTMTTVRPSIAWAEQGDFAGSVDVNGSITDTIYLPLIFNEFMFNHLFADFEALPNEIGAGTAVSLSWQVFDSTAIFSLSPDVGDVSGVSHVTVMPTDTTTYTLTAVGITNTFSETAVVTVIEPPLITDFSSDTEPVTKGESATLSWIVDNDPDSLSIDSGIGDVTGLTSVAITPTETTTYTLTANNIAGNDTEQVVVTVVDPPAPLASQFIASPGTINQGETSTLSWIVANADSVTIAPGVGDVTGQTSVVVSPNTTTTYTLTVSNGYGSDTVEVTVTVIQPPNITSFTASPGTINQGNSSTLSWNVTNAPTSLSINQGVGVVTGQSNKTVSPTSTKTYILTATNSAGSDTEQVTVTVNSASSTGEELLIFDWNEPVTTSHRGFPWDDPPMENGNWVTPINFGEGTLHFRAQIISQPVAQTGMKLQFCLWQFNNARETCGGLQNVPGTSGTVRTWSSEISTMWKKDGIPLDWSQPRYRNGVAIKNAAGLPVSDYLDWNWNGEIASDWYDLDMRFTVVVVEKGATFSGWDNYIP